MRPRIPRSILANACKSLESWAWLNRLRATVKTLEQQWTLKLGPAFDGPDVSCSFVAPAQRMDGTTAILKIGMPHFEARHEIDGLRVWSGHPTVQLLEADAALNAMLLERCDPGTSLRELPLPEQDKIIATLLRRLWRQDAVQQVGVRRQQNPSLTPAQKTFAISTFCAASFRRVTLHSDIRQIMRGIS